MSEIVTVEVSIGELLDKYSILELKRENIRDESRKNGVEVELEAIRPVVMPFMASLWYEYRLLKFINKVIWDLNDISCKSPHFDGRRLMDENNARFRVKKMINERGKSRICEQKSYSDSTTYINARGRSPLDAERVFVYAYFRSLYFEHVFIVVGTDEDHQAMRQCMERKAYPPLGAISVTRDAIHTMEEIEPEKVPGAFQELLTVS